MSLGNLITSAIASKNIVEFDYHGYHRIVELHVYGIQQAREQLLVYQIAGGSSSGGLPEWRRMDVVGITNFALTVGTFAGPRPYPSGKHSSFDRIIAVVK